MQQDGSEVSSCSNQSTDLTAECEQSYAFSTANGPLAFAILSSGYIYSDLWGTNDNIIDTEANATIGAPDISSVSPTYVFVGTNGTLTFGGQSFVNPFGGSSTTIDVSGGTGLTVSSVSVSETSATADYSASLTASTGQWRLGMSYFLGSTILQGVTNLQVGDPPPTITSISPSSWPAGATTTVTITGSGFGSNPQLSVSGTGVTATMTSHSDMGGPGGATIVANVIVSGCAPAGSTSITLTSTGYNGAGFVAAYSGEPSSVVSSATVLPAPAAAASVLFYGTNVAGKATNVVVGQQISLTSQAPTQACMTIASQKWSSPPGNAVGGFTAQAIPPLVTVSAVPSNTTSSSYGPLYWITGGTLSMTYQYTLANGQESGLYGNVQRRRA